MQLVLQDTNGGLWGLFVDANGGINTQRLSSGVPVSITLNDQAQTGSWSVSVSTLGIPATTPIPYTPGNLTGVRILNATELTVWMLGVTSTGMLQAFQSPYTIFGKGSLTAVNGIGQIN